MKKTIHGPHLESQNIKELCRSLSSNLDPDCSSQKGHSYPPTAKEYCRRDKLGNVIVKQNNQYHISFRDEIFKQLELADVKIVENWKEYNIIEEEQNKNGSCCKYDCLIM